MRTWKANKELKKSANRDRSYIKRRTDAIAKGGGKSFRKRLTLDEVKKRTRCKRCNQRGHWHRECTAQQKAFDAGFATHFDAGLSTHYGVFITVLLQFITFPATIFLQVKNWHKAKWQKEAPPEAYSSWEMTTLAHIENERTCARILPAGSALVDTGAGHPTCGNLYFERIEAAFNRCGVKSIVILANTASIPVCAKGVGGVASTKEVRFVPMR